MCPNTRKLNCPLNVPASPARGFRNLPMPATDIVRRRVSPLRRRRTADTISSLSLRKRRNGFALPKKRKGLVGNACPNTRKLNCPLNVPAPPARGCRKWPLPATHIVPTNEGTKPLLVRGGARRCGRTREVSATKDKQRAERRTAAIRFIKPCSKRKSRNLGFWQRFGSFAAAGKGTRRRSGEKLLRTMSLAGITRGGMSRRRAGGTLQCQYSGGKQRTGRRTPPLAS